MERMILRLLLNWPRQPATPAVQPPPDLYEDRTAWSADHEARWYYERRSFIG